MKNPPILKEGGRGDKESKKEIPPISKKKKGGKEGIKKARKLGSDLSKLLIKVI